MFFAPNVVNLFTCCYRNYYELKTIVFSEFASSAFIGLQRDLVNVNEDSTGG